MHETSMIAAAQMRPGAAKPVEDRRRCGALKIRPWSRFNETRDKRLRITVKSWLLPAVHFPRKLTAVCAQKRCDETKIGVSYWGDP
jgi:hypothetical protein